MFARTLYVQVRENQFEVRNLDHGQTIRRQANPGFSHPRMLVGNFTLAEQCLKDALHDARGRGFALTTSVLIHPCENVEGGLSQVEERLFHELAIGAGASQVRVWLGAPLNDAEVIERLKAG